MNDGLTRVNYFQGFAARLTFPRSTREIEEKSNGRPPGVLFGQGVTAEKAMAATARRNAPISTLHRQLNQLKLLPHSPLSDHRDSW